MNANARGRFRPALALTPALAALLLAGCGGNMQDLRAWAAHVRARPGPKLKPIPELTPYQSFAYPVGDLRSPFMPAAAPKVDNIHPNLYRTKEYLERFPLGALKFVGEIAFGRNTYALIQDPGGIVHRVQVGNYLGQNSGRITAILADRIQLTEIVPDGSGGYIRRPASLPLAGSNGGQQ